jgi:FkbM family methyltransferase
MEIALLSSSFSKFLKRYPIGRHWPFDVLRFSEGKQPTTVFDVGANTGMTSRYMRKFFPKARIHAFEPVNSTFQLLEKNLSHDPLIKLNQVALGDRDDVVPIEVDAYSQQSTFIHTANAKRTLESVTMIQLDSYCKSESVASIGILKMDVQGYECQVIEGAKHLIDDGKISFVYTEVGFREDDKENMPFSTIHKLLSERGFSLSGFYEPWHQGPRKEKLEFCNALYKVVD